MRRAISFLIIFTFFYQQIAFAQSMNRPFGEDLYSSRINEYFYNKSDRDILKPVKIFGSVQKPGLYHIPEKTPFTTLFAIAGGATSEAETDEILIKRADGSVLERDLFKIVAKGQDVPLQEGDVIFIKKQEGWLNAPSTSNLIVLTSILSVLISAVIVSREK